MIHIISSQTMEQVHASCYKIKTMEARLIYNAKFNKDQKNNGADFAEMMAETERLLALTVRPPKYHNVNSNQLL